MRRSSLSNTFTKGVLDPALADRIDLDYYYEALADGVNLTFRPQGGLDRRPGTTLQRPKSAVDNGLARRLRRRIMPVPISAAMVSAPNGGTPGIVVDQDRDAAMRTNGVDDAVFVVAEIDLGQAEVVDLVDVARFRCETGSYASAVVVEYEQNGGWHEFTSSVVSGAANRKVLTTARRSRRWGAAPGGIAGQRVSARRWRIVVYGAVGAGWCEVGEFRLWREGRDLSRVRLVTYPRASGVSYDLVITDRNIDIYADGAFLSAAACDAAGYQLDEIQVSKDVDNVQIYHGDVATGWLVRDGSDSEWGGTYLSYVNVPPLPSRMAFAGNQDEVQDIDLGTISAGDKVVVWLGPRHSAALTFVSASAFGTLLQATLAGLGGSSGVVVEQISLFPLIYRVAFRGSMGARRWPVVFVQPLRDGRTESETTVVQRGVAVGEAFFGDRNGYPSCGVIYQSRHIIGGFRASPQSWAISRFDSAVDFTDDVDDGDITADLAMFGDLASDLIDPIRQVHVGQHITFMTDTSEWYLTTRALDATEPPTVSLAHRYGISPACQAVYLDGRSLFVQRGGRVLRDMAYSDLDQNYQAEPLSLLGPHLLQNVVRLGVRPARTSEEAHFLFLINADGTASSMALLRSQKVVALCPWQSGDAVFVDAAADVLGRMKLITRRDGGPNGADHYLEVVDEGHTLDAAIAIEANQGTIDEVSGLDHLEDEKVWAWLDGDLFGPLVVSGGVVALPVPASRAIVGYGPALYARPTTLRERLQNGYPWRPPARVYSMTLGVAATAEIDLATNGGPFRPVNLSDINQARSIGSIARDEAIVSGGSAGTSNLEALSRALCMIPAATEFGYATSIVEFREASAPNDSPPDDIYAFWPNRHGSSGKSDFEVSVGQAQAAFPNLRNVSLFSAWFGNDLRCQHSQIRPKVDHAHDNSKLYHPFEWQVCGVSRSQAQVVSSLTGGGVAYGGTPSDRSMIEAIQKIKQDGLAVTLTPFVLMDVSDGNTLPNPEGGSGQPKYPWRGRITCHPAPGVSGSPDATSAAGGQVNAFLGGALPQHFATSTDGFGIDYTGPSGFGYRRFILHHAALARAAGGVDTFVIGSEMRDLTRVRSSSVAYPFVFALKTLAADVRTMLGASTKIVYAADWSEFPPHQLPSGDLNFNLDGLWSDPNIDAIGIDNYWPLSDWRDGSQHKDYLDGTRSVKDIRYLQDNIEGGEGYDWYYASQADRDQQVRTPITDGLGKPWVYRFKDIKSWWLNSHRNRVNGVEQALTSWVPQSKPIWFMEMGCAAIDRGANQPNKFSDQNSSESGLPYYSRGNQDVEMMRQYISAMLKYYQPGEVGFEESNNPVSDVYSDRMIDLNRLYLYTWDARFHPAFPDFDFVWSDAENYETGHWLNGRTEPASGGVGGGSGEGRDFAVPLSERLVTGYVRVTNLRGFSRHPTIEIKQDRPAPLTIRSMQYEVQHG